MANQSEYWTGGAAGPNYSRFIGQFSTVATLPPAASYVTGTLAFVVADKSFREVTAGDTWATAQLVVDVAAGSITTAELASNSVTTVKINDLAVTSGKLATSAVVTSKIADYAVDSSKLATSAVTTRTIAAFAVTSAELNSNAVITDRIADGAVTRAKLESQAAAVTTAKIAANAVGNTALDNTAAFTFDGRVTFGQALEETSVTIATAGLSPVLDLSAGSVFDVTLTATTATMSFSNAPSDSTGFTLIARQDASGSRTVTWPGTVDWPDGGVAPTLSTGSSAVDILTFITPNGGTTWFGFLGGLDFQ